MPKLNLFTRDRVSRFALSLLLTLGVLLPFLFLFHLQAYLLTALSLSAGLLAALNFIATQPKLRWAAWGLGGIFLVVQVFLPRMGLLGGWLEACKAISLYISGLEVALTLFAGQAATLLTVVISFFSFLFSKKGAGFLPAAIIVVLTLFAVWAMGEARLMWFALPALAALLLLISQTAHEKINLFHVLPMAAVVVLAAMLLLPGGRVTFAPLEKAAMELKQAITDYLFFTEPRNVFTLGSYGYYPMGGNQLGGEATPSEFPVMMVKTDRKTLLRAVVKDEYTGRSFRDTSSAKRYLYVNPRWASLRERVFLEKMPPEALRRAGTQMDERAVTIQMQNNAASTLFTPLFLRKLDTQSNMVPYFNDASELFITRDLTQGDRYTVYTPIVEGGDPGLDALVNAALKDDKEYASILNEYSQLPDHLEKKVYDDVRIMTADAGTPYEKAMAIMRHLQKYYRYTLSPDTPPDNLDFVTYFLYVSKEGYCTYFASAMTVLCRMAGLPARYVEGFLANPASDGFAYVTGKEAHAWTEVYFEGFGWIPFDPTPPQQEANQPPPPNNAPQDNPEPTPTPTPNPEQPNENPTPSPEPQPSEEPAPQTADDPESEPPEDKPPFPWWILAVLAAVAGVVVRIVLRMPAQVAKKAKTEKDRLFLYGSAVAMLLRMRGLKPKPGETPLRYARRADTVHAATVPVLPLWRMMALSNYSRKNPPAGQDVRAKEIFLGVYKPLSWLHKLRFMMLAAFDKHCYTALDTVVAPQITVSTTQLPPLKAARPAPKGKGKGKSKKSRGSPKSSAASAHSKSRPEPKAKDAPPSPKGKHKR